MDYATDFATIDARVRELIADVLGCPLCDVKPGAALGRDLGADALDLVELAMQIEAEYGFDIHEESIDGWQTVSDVAGTVALHIAPAPE